MNAWSWTRRVQGSRAQRKAAAELLTQCVRDPSSFDLGTAAGVLAQSSPEIVLAMADYHGVSGMVYERLQALEAAPEPFMAELRERYASAVHGHMRVLWELGQVQSVLDGIRAPWAVIKGPAAVELLYSAPGQRAYNDLDLLIDPGAFRDVLDALLASGARMLDRNWARIRREMLGEVHLLLPGGTPLDLHWNLINMNRGRMRVDSTEVLRRAGRTDLGGVSVCTLDPVDTVVHLALHAAISGGDKLLWLKDVERAAVVLAPSWEAVVERARRWNVAAPVGLILGRSLRVLSAPIPAWVPGRLLGAGSTRLVRIVERASPWEFSVGRLTAASHILSRNIGEGPVAASLWFVRRSFHYLDPREPARSSTFTTRGDDADRKAFIDAVIRSGTRRPSSES